MDKNMLQYSKYRMEKAKENLIDAMIGLENQYEKKERLLRKVRAGTATQAQKEWLVRWGFLEKPKPPLKPTYDSPTRTNKVYRYRGAMKATPLGKLEGPGGPGTRRNRYGNLVTSNGEGNKRGGLYDRSH